MTFPLLLLFLAPPLLALGGPLGVAMWAAGSAWCAATTGWLGVQAAALAMAAGCVLFLARRWRLQALAIGIWAAIITVPLWAPVRGWVWSVWPGAALAGERWDPLRGSFLYPHWGSAEAMLEPAFPMVLTAWCGLALALRILPAAAPILSAETPPVGTP